MENRYHRNGKCQNSVLIFCRLWSIEHTAHRRRVLRANFRNAQKDGYYTFSEAASLAWVPCASFVMQICSKDHFNQLSRIMDGYIRLWLCLLNDQKAFTLIKPTSFAFEWINKHMILNEFKNLDKFRFFNINSMQ